MSISRDEVYWLYRVLLGRSPESEEVYSLHMRIHSNFDNARHTFIASKEFQDKIYPPTFYRQTARRIDDFTKPKSLALACILRNEQKRVPLMLYSCIPLVSFVVVLDTGSTDDTIAVAKDILSKEGVPHIVSRTDFFNFSQARNEALSLVPLTMEWVLMLDGDEHLVSEDYPLFESLMSSNADACALPRYSFTDANKVGPVQSYPDYQRRLLRHRAIDPVRYSGIVHENIAEPFVVQYAPANTERFSGTTGGPHIHHFGGVDPTKEELQAKLDLYLNLLHASD